jgi:hypothetical protein
MASSFSSSDGSRTSSSIRVRTRSQCSGEEEILRPKKSLRNIKYCTECLPTDLRPLWCSGCVLYQDASEASKKGPRENTHSSLKYQCDKPWTKDPLKPSSYDLRTGNNVRIQKIHDYLNSQGYSRRALGLEAATPATKEIQTTQENETVSPLTAETEMNSSSAMATETTTTTTRSKSTKELKEDIEVYTAIFSSMGHEFEIDGVPITHEVVNKNRLEKLRNADQMIRNLRNGLQRNQRFGGGSMLMRSLIAIAVTSCPALPLSQACNLIPLFAASVLVDVGILQRANISSFSKSFASETSLRELVFSFAAENMYQLGVKVKGLQIFLACDKGNKKGVSHFVKMLSWYDKRTYKVVHQLLDIDASEGATEDCADGIAASLKKIGSVRLDGQCTDSGGGGVLDSLHLALETRQLTRPGYLVASCGLHNLQLSFANPIKKTIGEGGLEKKNLMQLLHSISDLQESMDKEIWQMHVSKALVFLEANCNTPYIGQTDADRQYAAKWEQVKTFRAFDSTLTKKELQRTNYKIPTPVLTRWSTVGETARVVWSAYLLLLQVSQQVINSRVAAKQTKIASGLQPLLLELEIFSDLALVNCFYDYFLCPHFDWMQSATDLTAIPGFQSHNTLLRYFLMVEDLTAISISHTAFTEFNDSLNKCDPQLRQRQVNKASQFVSASLDAVHKHFSRWCNASLLPAALMSEKPMSIVVASVLLGKQPPPCIPVAFESDVHFKAFDVLKFHEFLLSTVPQDNVYPAMVKVIANQLYQSSLDLREMDNEESEYKALKEFMYSKYLPLASQTQFVEAGVKEAKNVSPTNRSEMLRSAYAVSRSARVHSIGDLRYIKSTKRIEELIHSAIIHSDEHEAFKSNDPNYKQCIDAIAKNMRDEHFKEERLRKMEELASARVYTNRKENIMQKKT